MAEYISLLQLQKYMQTGAEIQWIGHTFDETISIKIYYEKIIIYKYFDLSTLKVPTNCDIIKHNEATANPLSFVGVTWQRQGWLYALRKASIYGINIGSRCTPGLGIEPKKITSACTMGYDIEVSLHLVKDGGFPPSTSRITSIALWCTCGYCEAWTTIAHRAIPYLNYCKYPRQLVRQSLNAIASHCPQWLVGYNCYQFDNCCLVYHCPRDMLHIFRNINTGAKTVSRNAFYIDIHGVNNVDLYSYLDKCLRSKYKALNLGAIAEYHKLKGKMQMPITDDESTVFKLIEYNINDSSLTAKLWHLTGVCEQVIGLCVASCSPPIDCIRYVTGTMTSCAVSSYCISNNMLMDWSECNLRIGYEGGSVLEPIRDIFRDVIVCDFSGMYPNIMKDVAISPENITILGDCSGIHADKLLHWNKNCTMACIKGKIVKYNNNTQCMTRNVLTVITELRNKFKVTNSTYALALKVLANSLYGALGFASSPLHSPRCAATVTVVGRTALMLAYKTFTGLGLVVSYGDTDSCFLSASTKTTYYFNGDINKHVTTALKIFHNILKYTPMPNLRMEQEDKYISVLHVDKKNYAYADNLAQIKTKGLSETRKDRLGICRDMTMLVAKQLLLSKDKEDARHYITKMIDMCFTATLQGQLDMYSVSKEVRYEGNSCYRYISNKGEEMNIPVSRADKTRLVQYDPQTILKFLEKDINRLCIPAGIGTVHNMLEDNSF